MLAGLDAIPWHELRHAYGPATDVPGLLRDLAADDVARVDAAIDQLFGNIWHQGTVYEATPYVVPFLLELLEGDSVHQRHMLLDLLAAIATGSSYLRAHGLDYFRHYAAERGRGATAEEQLEIELGWVSAAHNAVAEGIRYILRLAAHADPHIGAHAAYTLGCFPERAGEIVPALRVLFSRALPSETHASILLALGVLAPGDSESIGLFQSVIASGRVASVRLAASLALARAWRDTRPVRAVGVLAKAAEDPGWGPAIGPWDRGGSNHPVLNPSPFDMLFGRYCLDAPASQLEELDMLSEYICARHLWMMIVFARRALDSAEPEPN